MCITSSVAVNIYTVFLINGPFNVIGQAKDKLQLCSEMLVKGPSLIKAIFNSARTSLSSFSFCRRPILQTLMLRVEPASNSLSLIREAESGPWWQAAVPQWYTGTQS